MPRTLPLVTAGVAGCAVAILSGAPAHADSEVTVRGLGFPDGRLTQLSMVGCASLYERTDEPLQPFIGRGPGQAPLGTRNLGYDLAGGNAVGSLHYLDSMAGTTVAELSVYAAEGAQGVAYAGFQEPGEAHTSRVWIGRATLTAPAGRWDTVRAPGLTYSWTKYDLVTQRVVATTEAPAAATGPVFAATHGGDGAGFYTIGFGCDGGRFSTDAWRVGRAGDITTYDLEGLATTTEIAGSQHQVAAGDPVTLTGQVRHGRGDRLRRATLMLESKPAGGRDFEVVGVYPAADTDPSAVVHPTESTIYRWRFADRPVAEGSESELFVVTVASAATPELPQLAEPTPTGGPDPSPSQEASGEPAPTEAATPDAPLH